MTILITGASGFVGSYLSSRFINENKKLFLISRKNSFFINNKKIILTNINNLNKLENLFKKKIDHVVHCASLNEKLTNKNKNLAYKTALKGTENLLKLSVKYKIKKFFFFSVLQVYGKEIVGNIRSKKNLKLQNDYAISHFKAEELIKNYHKRFKLNVNILRLAYSFTNPISKKVKRTDLIPINFCISAVRNNIIKLTSDGSSRRDFIHLNDVFLKIKKLIQSKNNNMIYYNCSSGNTFKVIEIAKFVQDEASKLLKKKIILKVNLKNKMKENIFNVQSDIFVKRVNKKKIENQLRREIRKIIMSYKK